MNTYIKVLIVILATAIFASILIGNAKASELSDYRDLVNNQTTLRNYYALQDMAYTYARYNPNTMNLDWSGYWATN